MDLTEACFHLRHRRRMYLPDDRYASVVSFLTGLSCASEDDPLAGFSEWVAERLLGRTTPRIWSSVVYETTSPDSLSRESDAVTLLLDLLELFARGGADITAEGGGA